MTDFLGLPPLFLLLLPLALAAGADLYLTFLVLSLSSWLGAGALGLVSLTPLGGTTAIFLLTGLYLAEALAELRPLPALVWHNVQLLLRPLGGMLLGLLLLEGQSLAVQILGVAGAGVVAAFSHVLCWGGGFLLRVLPPGRVSAILLNLALDTATLALVVLALERPAWAFPLAAVFLLASLVLGGSLHGATRFGFALLWDRVWGFSSPPAWRSAAEMPRWVRKGAHPDPHSGLRGLRAGALGLPGSPGFRDGWIVERGQELLFLYSRAGRARSIPLQELAAGREVPGPLALTLHFQSGDGHPRALFLQKTPPGFKSHKC